MNTVTYRISLDVNKNGIQRTIQGVETGDIYARSVVITLRNNKEDYELPQNGIEAIMYPILPDGTKLEGRPCNIEGNRIIYRIQPGDIEQVGLVRYQLKIIGTLLGGASAVLVSPRFELEVWESDADDEPMVEAENFTELQNLIAKADAYYNGKRITDVIIDEDYLIKVIFADGTTYESDALKTLSDKIISHDEAIADLTENKLDKRNPVAEGELTAPSISTYEIKNDGNLTLPPNVILKEGTTYLRQNEILTKTIYADEIKKRSDSQPVAIDEIAIPGKVEEVGASIVNINTEISTLRTEEEADFNSVNGRIDSVESTKMDKNNPTGTGVLTIPNIKVSTINTYGEPIDINGDIEVRSKNGYSWIVGENFDAISDFTNDILKPKINKISDDVAYIQENYYKSGDDSHFNQIKATLYMGDHLISPANFASDITLYSGKSREIKVTPTIESMQSDIEDLKARPSAGASLILTSASPLTNSTSANILGIDAIGKSEQNGTPTPTNPIPIIDASGEVEAHTKNLFDTTATTETKSSITATKNSDGSISLSGTATANTTLFVTTFDLKKGTYTFSGANDGSASSFYLQIADNPITKELAQVSTPKTLTFNEDTSITFRIRIVSGATVNTIIYPQIEEGSTASAYVPYQSNTITFPYTLKSVGEVKDELIVNTDGTGKLIQRVCSKTFTVCDSMNNPNTETALARFELGAETLPNYSRDYICTHSEANTARSNDTVEGSFIYYNQFRIRKTGLQTKVAWDAFLATSPITIYYPLETPIETPLTASEVASIRALQTYDGTTIVDSEMEIASVSYSGDIKGYIDSAVKPNEIGEIAYSEYGESTTFTITFDHPINVGDRFTAEADHFYSASAIQSTTYGIVIDNGGKAFSAKIAGGLALPTVTWEGNSLTFVFGTSTIKGYVNATKTGKVNASPAMAMALSEVADE